MENSGYVLDLRVERLESEEAAEELLREIMALVEQNGAQLTGYAVRDETPSGEMREDDNSMRPQDRTRDRA